MRITIMLFLALFSTSIFASDNKRFSIVINMQNYSYVIISCMVKKSFNVIEGTEHGFDGRFYHQCMKSNGNIANQFPAQFKAHTIKQFHEIIDEINMTIDGVRT